MSGSSVHNGISAFVRNKVPPSGDASGLTAFYRDRDHHGAHGASELELFRDVNPSAGFVIVDVSDAAPMTNPSRQSLGQSVVDGAANQFNTSVSSTTQQAVSSELSKFGILLLVIGAIAAAVYLVKRKKST